jgi:glucose-6-phosphate isomerase
LDTFDKGQNMMWGVLADHADTMKEEHLAALFAGDPQRFERLHCECGPVLFDYSKQRLTEQTLSHLFDLARQSQLPDWISRLFSGDAVNCTENRSAMHWALRLPREAQCLVGGVDITAQVHEQLERMERIVNQLHAGQWRGVTGEVVTDVVNIGVGGSDLGPQMVCDALCDSAAQTASRLTVHFASTMDGSQLSQLLRELNPHSTLFIISSKSFTTIDTLSNADTARNWLARTLGDGASVLHRHFLGVSSAADKMSAWGISEEHQLGIWDWVGGRYSLWSAIGLPVALTVGMDGFRQLLAGAHLMDEHFKSAPWESNLPVLMLLPMYLEQLEMESNGKSVNREGEPVAHHTCPIIWGDVGPNAQHAFYQLLHQGTEAVTCDFIMPARRYHEPREQGRNELIAQHELALANCLAQSRLLALGDAALDDPEQMAAYQRYRGNQPSSTLLLDELSPYALGALIAMYEHKVFVQSVVWGINPFDQWGVEMGKRLAVDTLARVCGERADLDGVDSSTAGLLARISKL